MSSKHAERRDVTASPLRPTAKVTISKRAFSFPPELRLKKKSDFAVVQDAAKAPGSKLYAKHFLILVAPSSRECSRLGITVTTKVEKRAVGRNYLKRCIREVFRLHHDKLKSKVDLIVIARNDSQTLDFEAIERELIGALRNGRLLKSS